MNRACQEFRARLAQALGPSAQRVFAPELEWHTHVLTCGACRALLEAEQALEHVLASLPQPTLPPHLAQRVLERLAEQRVEAALDRTLDLALRDSADEGRGAPAQLASELLARLGPARAQAERERRLERALDRLLENVPPPQTPVGLSARVLKRLEAARRSSATPTRTSTPQRVRAADEAAETTRERVREPQRVARSWAWLAAAGVALFAGAAAWFLSRQGAGEARRDDIAIELPPDSAVRGDEMGPSRSPEPFAPRDSRSTPQVAQTAPESRPESKLDSAFDSAPGELEPDVELLAQLELLESWELLADEALDLELLGVDENTLLSLQSLEYETSTGEVDDTPAPSAPKSGADNAPKNG